MIDKEEKISPKRLIVPIVVLVVALLIPLVPFGKKRIEEPSLAEVYPVMGGGITVELKLYGDRNVAEKASRAIRDEFELVTRTCNIFDTESEVSKLNSTAFEEPFKCSDELWEVLEYSRKFYYLSGGAFDISAKPLMDMWGFYRKIKKLPTKKDILKIKESIGLDKVIFDDKTRTVQFTHPDLGFDLGGIAKGWAVDRAAKIAAKFGITKGVINLAGNMYAFPIPPEGKKSFNIGIRSPLDKNKMCGTVGLLNSSIATSGNYERYVVIDGKRYTHIMDINRGIPVKNMLSVTVITPLAVAADALSTAVFIKGSNFAKAMCEQIPGTSVLIIKHPKDDINAVEVIKFGSAIWDDIVVDSLRDKCLK